ncbi:hypothetical protein EW093_03085 [Thiospirochaeta perfilievii]|uniref:Uncharacterized protein n=1 Tax=Thiospirochaeta perfilievii TaxID=252967 RepID=A0A5C1Q6V2_9SPIO|nr:hypothetical protein [Thiospirochaeta perfilievii]QEN03725.1 hypothetical protein EW093_03085 [Thiospirochaeta perfilievii]
MENSKGKNNARSLFGIEMIPTDNHIRNLLDECEASLLYPAYLKSFEWIKKMVISKSTVDLMEPSWWLLIVQSSFHQKASAVKTV